MPNSLSSDDVAEKRFSHDENLDACLLRPRPMRVRKVGTSGTKGQGLGIGCRGRDLCRNRICSLCAAARPVFGAKRRNEARSVVVTLMTAAAAAALLLEGKTWLAKLGRLDEAAIFE